MISVIIFLVVNVISPFSDGGRKEEEAEAEVEEKVEEKAITDR